MSDTTPGWWSTDAKHKAVEAFNAESDPAKRAKLYEDVQKVIYDEAPIYKVGDFNALAAQAPELKGVTPAPWPFFWNAWLEK
jgi:peptide/nickel transport system substrate-binding protein